MEVALSTCENSFTDNCSDRILYGSGYANAVVLPSRDLSKLQLFLDRLGVNVDIWDNLCTFKV